VRELAEFDGEFPVATMADEMLTPDRDKCAALVTVAGNPVLSTPDGVKLDAALSGLSISWSASIRTSTRRRATPT